MIPLPSQNTLDGVPAHARVWVYKSADAFTPQQRDAIDAAGRRFVATWSSHNVPLDAWAGTLLDHFLVIAVDQEQAAASGCGIDKSVRFVQDLERGMGLQLTDRMVVIYERDGVLHSTRVQDVPRLLQGGELTEHTTVFNDLVATKGDLDRNFRVHLKDSWMARFL
ncbi:MAG TPA: hypothetical protein VGE21_05520 [Flavobacteriales bacterium]